MTYSPLSTPFALRSANTSSRFAPQVAAANAWRTGRAAAFIVASIARAARANQLVFATWTRNDGTATLVAKEPVRLGALLNGEWTPNGYTLTAFTVVGEVR